jgi:hypothetical protein
MFCKDAKLMTCLFEGATYAGMAELHSSRVAGKSLEAKMPGNLIDFG